MQSAGETKHWKEHSPRKIDASSLIWTYRCQKETRESNYGTLISLWYV